MKYDLGSLRKCARIDETCSANFLVHNIHVIKVSSSMLCFQHRVPPIVGVPSCGIKLYNSHP